MAGQKPTGIIIDLSHFEGMFLTGISELLDLIPKIMDREIIRLFETGAIKTSKGQRWGYLMCFGAAGLRLMSFIITNYSE